MYQVVNTMAAQLPLKTQIMMQDIYKQKPVNLGMIGTQKIFSRLGLTETEQTTEVKEYDRQESAGRKNNPSVCPEPTAGRRWEVVFTFQAFLKCQLHAVGLPELIMRLSLVGLLSRLQGALRPQLAQPRRAQATVRVSGVLTV